jgi:cell division control protein 6
MKRITDDSRLKELSEQEELLQSVVNAQLEEFHHN